MITHCLFDELVSVKKLKPHPKNRNKHGDDQIKRLADILKYQGWRYPIKVSKLSGFITSGHGRLLAAKLNGWDKVPVNFQEYESEEQEYADCQADNAIASWAELDLSGINSDIGDLGPDFDIDLLGIRNFTIDPMDNVPEDWVGMPEFDQTDKTSVRQMIVHFKTHEDAEGFGRLIGQNITDKTRSIWHPKADIESCMDKRYGEE